MGDDTRRKILERRATFVAAALASVTVTASCERGAPSVCLKVAAPRVDSAPVDDTTSDGGGSDTSEVPDAASDATDGGADASDARPHVPMPCLKIAPPKDAGPPPSAKPLTCLWVDK